MIALARRRGANDVPAAFKPPMVREKYQLLAEIYFASLQGQAMAFSSTQWKPAKNALKKDSRGKCAYCEAPTDSVAHGDVEHFRPKSIYWWLAFCFDNYLYSCQICNQTYKSDHFPIRGVLAAAPQMPAAAPAPADLAALIDRLVHDPTALTDDALRVLWDPEQADIVNPYLENPEPLFVYEVDAANQEIWSRSTGGARADRAAAAADQYLGLNREELRRERFVHYSPLAALSQILALANLPATARVIAETEVRRMQAASEPFAGMRRFFARNWGLPGPA